MGARPQEHLDIIINWRKIRAKRAFFGPKTQLLRERNPALGQMGARLVFI